MSVNADRGAERALFFCRTEKFSQNAERRTAQNEDFTKLSL